MTLDVNKGHQSPAAGMLPESPTLDASPSPDMRPGGSRQAVAPLPGFLSSPSPGSLMVHLEASLTPKGKGNTLRASLILRHAIRWAVEHTDVELLSWLINLGEPWYSLLSREVEALEDEDGWGAVGMMIQASCGRQEMEEGVRLIVGRWGLHVGPRKGRCHSGWTPLHLAALVSTPPLVSFLLTRGASPHELTHRGLTPYDLVSDMPDRQQVAVLLDHTLAPPPAEDIAPSLSSRRESMLRRRRSRAVKRQRLRDENERQKVERQDRERWIRSMADIVEVSPALLLESEEEDTETTETPLDRLYESSLVFSLTNLDRIYDIFITQYRPQCYPLSTRTLPANALYLQARFAHYQCDDTWLEELIEGAVQRIEQGVYGNIDDLAYLAFWAYNATVLLHLLSSDEGLLAACEELELLVIVKELIHAIHVFIIRVAEQRIDSVLDAALLDYENLDLNDVRFEGDWNFFKSMTGRTKKTPIKAADAFATPKSEAATAEFGSPSLFGSLSVTGSPFKTMRSQSSFDADDETEAPVAPMEPRRITDILSAVLLVLNLYQVNPAMTIQAFSQIFYWVSSEMFNRILTRKKYLCRSKAIQIKMNLTVLDDWIRANDLPSRTATHHLEKVSQLLQWLQCSSQIRQFDTLIGTLQTLKGLNPLQMRRAVRDYRFEVNEGKMTEECSQYISQLQKDWERRRLQRKVEEMQGVETPAAPSGTIIDELFNGSTLDDFEPASGPECLGELVDSRYMLPFQLPRRLMAARVDGKHSGVLNWSQVDDKRLRQLPPDFFRWFKETLRVTKRPLGTSQIDMSAIDKEASPVFPASTSMPATKSRQKPLLRSSQSHEALRERVENQAQPTPFESPRSAPLNGGMLGRSPYPDPRRKTYSMRANTSDKQWPQPEVEGVPTFTGPKEMAYGPGVKSTVGSQVARLWGVR